MQQEDHPYILYTNILHDVQKLAKEFFEKGLWEYEPIDCTVYTVKLLHGSQPDSMEEGSGYVYAKCRFEDDQKLYELFVMCYIEDGTIETQLMEEIAKKVVLKE